MQEDVCECVLRFRSHSSLQKRLVSVMDFERVPGLHDGHREHGLQAFGMHESGKNRFASAQSPFERSTILYVKFVAKGFEGLIRRFHKMPSSAYLKRDHIFEGKMRGRRSCSAW